MITGHPVDFIQHACACAVRAAVCALRRHPVGSIPAMLIGTGVVILNRSLSAHFRRDLSQAYD